MEWRTDVFGLIKTNMLCLYPLFFWSFSWVILTLHGLMITETNFTAVGEWKYSATIIPVSFQEAVSWSFLFVISISVIYARGVENPALC